LLETAMSEFFDTYPWLLTALEVLLPPALVAYIVWYVRRPPHKRD
jgi:hypothetical protein